MILCNPHNPVGNVWTAEELARIGELCHKYGVKVISDEIHCEFTSPGCTYTPFASVNQVCRDISVTLISASKSFNLAGLCSAVAVAHDPSLRAKVYRCLNTDEVGEPGAFAIQGNMAAFRWGEEWLDELLDYVNANKSYAVRYISENIPALKAVRSDATYLLWVDISGVGMDSRSFVSAIREKTGLVLSAGESYGSCGTHFVRINLGTQRSRVEDGLCRLKLGVEMIAEGR
jgi:cystathionine beta-lyase